MISLETAGQRFESTLLKESGLPFKGVFQPLQDQKIYADDYYPPRQILRVHPTTPVAAGEVVVGPNLQWFILGALDHALSGDHSIYMSFQLFPVTHTVVWKRDVVQVDPLTKLPRSTGKPATIGTLRVLMETVNREAAAGPNGREEIKRVVTGAAVELNDMIDGMKVKKLNVSRGIRILELT